MSCSHKIATKSTTSTLFPCKTTGTGWAACRSGVSDPECFRAAVDFTSAGKGRSPICRGPASRAVSEGRASDQGHAHLCRESPVRIGLQSPAPCSRQTDGASSEVSVTSCRLRKSQLNEVCPTAVSSRNFKLNEDDVTASSSKAVSRSAKIGRFYG